MTSERQSNTEFPRSIGKVAARELAASGFTRFDQLAQVSRGSLLSIHGVGPKSVNILQEELRRRGMDFRGD